jgi:hypothetical protein
VATAAPKHDPNEEKLAALVAEHGPIGHHVIDGRLIAFRRPTLEEWEDYQEALAKKRRGVAFRELALRTVLVPSQDDLPAIFERWPGIAARISDTLADLVGADQELTIKKG